MEDAYYLKNSGAMAEKEWIFDKSYNSWFYLKSGGAYASREWIGAYYLKSGGYMAKNEWIFDPNYNAWYYLKEDGSYVTGSFNIKIKSISSRVMESGFKVQNILRLNQSQPIFIANQEIF